MKLHSKAALLCVGYGLMEFLQRIDRKKALVWSNYHDFPIATVPSAWIHPFLSSLGIDPGDITVQIGKCEPHYLGKSHYHLKGHQLVIPIGEKEHFEDPKHNSIIYISWHEKIVFSGDAYYFPTKVSHNFRGDFYFINIQNPPLELEGSDDYYEA